jgi:hypothetical protein
VRYGEDNADVRWRNGTAELEDHWDDSFHDACTVTRTGRIGATMIAYIILIIFIVLAAFSLKFSRRRKVKSEINIKKILAHAPKDEDKMQR